MITFGVNPSGAVKKSAERQGIPLKTYKIIYQLIEDVQRMIRGQIEPEFEEKVIGHAEVRAVIRVPRSGNIAGSYVTNGVLRRNAKARAHPRRQRGVQGHGRRPQAASRRTCAR